MKTKKLILVMGLGATVLISGCSSIETGADVAKQEAEVQQIRAEANDQAVQHKQTKLEAERDLLPQWIVEPPRADSTGFYGVGLATDSDMLSAMRKSKLQAEYELASTLKSELSGEDTMTGSGQGEYRYIINNFVSKVHLTGVEVVKQKLIPINGQYKAFTLMKLPYNKFNVILKNQASSTQSKTLQQSYERLMKKVKSEKAEVIGSNDDLSK